MTASGKRGASGNAAPACGPAPAASDEAGAGRRRGLSPVAVSVAASLAACSAIVVATAVLKAGSYYLAAAAMIVCAMVPFVASFENRRPQAREVVLLAVMCALAAASRAAFVWVPHFKPMAAIVMITGIALGPQSGFLAGAVSVLASNFLFGQGYWTPWQMLAFGLAGLVFGAAFGRDSFRRGALPVGRRVALAAAGGAFVMLVLGPVLDTSSVLMFLSRMTPEGVLAIYLAGVPVNAVHALATAATLLLAANPILSRVSRVSLKFGLYER